MDEINFTVEEATEAERILDVVKGQTEVEIRQLGKLLASKPSGELLHQPNREVPFRRRLTLRVGRLLAEFLTAFRRECNLIRVVEIEWRNQRWCEPRRFSGTSCA